MKYTMKNTFKYIAFGIALLASSFALSAQTYHEEGGMKTSKKVEGPAGGYYTITLESFATGESTVTETGTPVDIVLVLDVSGSMNYDLNTYSYTARNSLNYSWNSYGNNTYYYLHTDGKYYPVVRYRNDNWNRFRLYYTVDETNYYLSGTGVTTTAPDNVTQYNANIWTGVLYNRSTTSTESRIDALKRAVQTFVNTVHHNALYDSKDNERGTPLTNQIAVVKYAYNRFVNADGSIPDNNYTGNNIANAPGANSINPGNHRWNNNNNNPTEVVVGFTDVSTNDGVNRVMGTGNYTGVTDLTAGGATASNFGMFKAVKLLDTVSERESNKVVVLFTDGEPTYSNSFQNAVANSTIDIAKTLKNDYKATVFTIGVFDEETADIKEYMNRTSSNYPNATGMGDGGAGTGGSDDKGFYQNASGANLEEIFKAVAHASGASDATAGPSTQVRDVISNSFIMPDGDAAQITFQVADITSNGEDWEDPEDAEGISYEITTVTTSTGEQHKQLMVTGFDYTKADVVDPDDEFNIITPGNWVGERYSDATTKYWLGKKLIISFKIKANEEATGGDGTATNHPDSGIYVQEFNEDGSPKVDGDGNPIYNRVNQYDVPHTPLPLLIKIKKDGLRKGESATFQLFRIRPEGWNDEGATLEEKMANVKYNAIGKPKPGIHTFDPTVYDKDGNPKEDETLDPTNPMDYLEGIGWIDWSKVILTNKTGDNDYVEKDLYGLDPGWVYLVVEDDWGWAYELKGTASNQTTSEYEINPFIFHNKPRTVNLKGDPIVKHAEAVTINHFKTMEEGGKSREEHYKSSKTNFQSTSE